MTQSTPWVDRMTEIHPLHIAKFNTWGKPRRVGPIQARAGSVLIRGLAKPQATWWIKWSDRPSPWVSPTCLPTIGIVQWGIVRWSLDYNIMKGASVNTDGTCLSWILWHLLNIVNSFLYSSTNYFENLLLPNDLIIVRNHGDDEDDEWDIKRALKR
jgi:hypothetical protein